MNKNFLIAVYASELHVYTKNVSRMKHVSRRLKIKYSFYKMS